MAVNSYRSVVYANEENANTRTAIAYVREKVRQHDTAGTVELSKLDGIDAIKMDEGEGYSLYIYWYGGYLMELEAKDASGVTADFGSKIMEVKEMSFSCDSNQLIKAKVVDEQGNEENVSIGIKSRYNKSDSSALNEDLAESDNAGNDEGNAGKNGDGAGINGNAGINEDGAGINEAVDETGIDSVVILEEVPDEE